jgi:hypothetical protein
MTSVSVNMSCDHISMSLEHVTMSWELVKMSIEPHCISPNSPIANVPGVPFSSTPVTSRDIVFALI